MQHISLQRPQNNQKYALFVLLLSCLYQIVNKRMMIHALPLRGKKKKKKKKKKNRVQTVHQVLESKTFTGVEPYISILSQTYNV